MGPNKKYIVFYKWMSQIYCSFLNMNDEVIN